MVYSVTYEKKVNMCINKPCAVFLCLKKNIKANKR